MPPLNAAVEQKVPAGAGVVAGNWTSRQSVQAVSFWATKLSMQTLAASIGSRKPMAADHKNGGETAPATLLTSCVRVVLGRPLANREGRRSEIGVGEGVPALGLDGLSSTAYGPEAALTILGGRRRSRSSRARAGDAGDPGAAGVLFASYWQTIEAYPKSGGAYTVAQDNLGVNASLLAATALMIDYVLTAAVGISAGVAALVSAVPVVASLHAAALSRHSGADHAGQSARHHGCRPAVRSADLSVHCLLRDRSDPSAFMPSIASGGHPHAVVPPPTPPKASEALGLWLLLRAFASGCTAMTGVEAVSNGVDAFREPRVSNAHRTLAVIVVTLGILLGGIAFLAMAYGVTAMDQTQPGYQSVLSQLVGAVAGRGVFYYVAIGSALVHPVSLRQHQLRRVSAAVPDGGAGRISAAAIRHCRTAPGLFCRHSLSRGHRRIAAYRVRRHHRSLDSALTPSARS